MGIIKRIFTSILNLIRPSTTQYEKAMRQYNKNNLGKAQELFQDIGKKEEAGLIHSRAKLMSGLIHKRLGQDRDAFQQLVEGFEGCAAAGLTPSVPDVDDIRYEIGAVAYRTEQYSKAMPWLLDAQNAVEAPKSSRSTSKHFAQIKLLRGRTYYMANDMEVSKTIFDELLSFVDERKLEAKLFAWAHAYIGCLSFLKGDFSNARDHFEDVANQRLDMKIEKIWNDKAKALWSITRWRAHTAAKLGKSSEAVMFFVEDIHDACFDNVSISSDKANSDWYLSQVCADLEKLWNRPKITIDIRETCKSKLESLVQALSPKTSPGTRNRSRIEHLLTALARLSPVSAITAPEIGTVPQAHDTQVQDLHESLQTTPGSVVDSQFLSKLDTANHFTDTPLTQESMHTAPSMLDPEAHAQQLDAALKGQDSMDNFIVRQTHKFDEKSISCVRKYLAKDGATTPLNPRLYIVLVRTGIGELLQEFQSRDITDYFLPLREDDFEILSANGLQLDGLTVQRFLREQEVVMSEDQNLCSSGCASHRHFSKTIDLRRPECGYQNEEPIYVNKEQEITLFRMRPVAGGDPVAVKRMGREKRENSPLEIDIVGGIDDKHVVKRLGSYTDPEYFVLIMKYADTDLEKYILESWQMEQRGGSLPQTRKEIAIRKAVLRRSIGCMAKTLRDLHHGGYKHRDLKPANILMHEDDAIFSDWGLARKAAGLDHVSHGAVGRTTFYAAPEVFARSPRTLASEYWSFGLVLVDIVISLKGLHPEWLHNAMLEKTKTTNIPGQNVKAVRECIEDLKDIGSKTDNRVLEWTLALLEEKPERRMNIAILFEGNIMGIWDEDGRRGGEYCGACCQEASK